MFISLDIETLSQVIENELVREREVLSSRGLPPRLRGGGSRRSSGKGRSSRGSLSRDRGCPRCPGAREELTLIGSILSSLPSSNNSSSSLSSNSFSRLSSSSNSRLPSSRQLPSPRDQETSTLEGGSQLRGSSSSSQLSNNSSSQLRVSSSRPSSSNSSLNSSLSPVSRTLPTLPRPRLRSPRPSDSRPASPTPLPALSHDLVCSNNSRVPHSFYS